MALKFYRCEKMGNISVKPYVKEAPQNSEPLVPNTVDAAKEKHVPVVTVNGNAVHVQVGSVLHPMTPEHYITFIALETKKGYQIVELTPDDQPVADFAVAEGDAPVAAYEYCNLHGLWKADVE
jgi:superoxide reductase